jgi:hypothetical protein
MKSADLFLVTAFVCIVTANVLAFGLLFWTMDVVHSAEASSPLAGHWRMAETEDEKKQRLQAIDEATERMGRFRRGKARSRLSERTAPRDFILIEVEGSKVTIGSENRQLELELGGPPIEVSGSEGKAQVSAKMEGERLIVEARSEKADRTTAYSANGDRLTIEVIMTNVQLAGPLKYVSTYARLE